MTVKGDSRILSEIANSLPIDTELHYTEACYQSLLRQLFERAGFFVKTEVICPYTTPCGITFGFGRVDLLVETDEAVFIVELKANVTANVTAEKQLRRYIIHSKIAGLIWTLFQKRNNPWVIQHFTRECPMMKLFNSTTQKP